MFALFGVAPMSLRCRWLLATAFFSIHSASSNGDRSCIAGLCKANANGTHLLQTKRTASVVSDLPVVGDEQPPLCDNLAERRCNEIPVCDWGTDTSKCHAKIAWLHIPKTGGSFGTTLAHFANSSLPQQAHIPSGKNLSDPEDLNEATPDGARRDGAGEANFFCFKYPVAEWFQDVFMHGRSYCNPGAHAEINDDVWSQWNGKFFGMFRQPEERIVSAFNHFANGTGDIVSYARRNWGGQTKMLSAREENNNTRNLPTHVFCTVHPNELEFEGRLCNESAKDRVPLAIERLRTGFAFVGLTGEWDLSVCLFHRMFGGECLPVEFANMRPHNASDETVDDDLELLRMDPDPWDGRIYEVASEIFWTNVQKYDVRRSTCQKTCPAAADLFDVYAENTGGVLLMEQVPGDGQRFEYDWPGRHVYRD